MTGLREIAKIHTGDFRLTPNQNLIIGNVTSQKKKKIEELVETVRPDGRASVTRRCAAIDGLRRAADLRAGDGGSGALFADAAGQDGGDHG